MAASPLQRTTTIEGRFWFLVIAGLLTGATLGLTFLSQEQNHSHRAQGLSTTLLKAQKIHLEFNRDFTQRAQHLTNLITNPRDDAQATLDMTEYIRHQENRNVLQTETEIITEAAGLSQQFEVLIENLTEWESLALQALDLRADNLG